MSPSSMPVVAAGCSGSTALHHGATHLRRHVQCLANALIDIAERQPERRGIGMRRLRRDGCRLLEALIVAADDDRQRQRLSVAPNRQLLLLSRHEIRDGPRQGLGFPDGLPGESGDDIAGLDAGMGSRRSVANLGDQRSLRGRQPKCVGDVRRDRLDIDADQPMFDRAVLHQLRDDLLGLTGRDRKSDTDAAAIGRIDRGVDTHDRAIDIDQRAARIAAVDRRVYLKEVVVRATVKVAAARRNDAGSDRRSDTERIADRQNLVAGPEPVGITPGNGG